VTAGILNRGKNVEMLIKCVSKIMDINLFLLVVGDGSTDADFRYKDYLKELSGKLGVAEKIVFTGWLEKEELWKIYLASDLFVLPSLSEGMPNAMLEALGSSLPCIGSDIPGIIDILYYEKLLFDPQSKTGLVNRIYSFFSDTDFSHKMRQLCEKRKDAFSFDWKEKLFQTITKGIDDQKT
jgi:glycosyltransferase involved in cell wall biosynthesis